MLKPTCIHKRNVDRPLTLVKKMIAGIKKKITHSEICYNKATYHVVYRFIRFRLNQNLFLCLSTALKKKKTVSEPGIPQTNQ